MLYYINVIHLYVTDNFKIIYYIIQMNNIFVTAKYIRRSGENWQDTIQRAKYIHRMEQSAGSSKHRQEQWDSVLSQSKPSRRRGNRLLMEAPRPYSYLNQTDYVPREKRSLSEVSSFDDYMQLNNSELDDDHCYTQWNRLDNMPTYRRSLNNSNRSDLLVKEAQEARRDLTKDGRNYYYDGCNKDISCVWNPYMWDSMEIAKRGILDNTDDPIGYCYPIENKPDYSKYQPKYFNPHEKKTWEGLL